MAFTAALALAPAVASAELALIDFGGNSQNVLSGWSAYTLPDRQTPSTQPAAAPGLWTSGQIDVLARFPTGADPRGIVRADRGGPLGDMYEDWVGVGDTHFQIELTGLAEGAYDVVSYNVDSYNQSFDFGVNVDGNQTLTARDSNQLNNTDADPPYHTWFQIASDGVNPVVIEYAREGGSFVMVNGMEITPNRGLRIDFGRTGQDIEPYWATYSGNDRSAYYAKTLATSLGVDDQVTLTVDDSTSGDPTDNRWITRNDRTNELGDMYEDWVGVQGDLSVTLDTLEPGVYDVISYNVDSLNQNFDFDVVVDGQQVLTTQDSNSMGDADGKPFSASYQVLSDGTSPITIQYQREAGSFSLINGLDIAPNRALRVDMGKTRQDIEPGWGSYTGDDHNDFDAQTMLTSLGVNNQVEVTVTTDAVTDDNRWITRGDRGNALGDIYEDWIGAQGGDLTLTLDGLAAGSYEMTSWHQDSDNQSFTFDVFLDGELIESGITSSALNSNDGTPTAVTYDLVSDGITPIEFQFALTGGDFMILNGFHVTRVPEPSSALLALLGGLFAVSARRRRR